MHKPVSFRMPSAVLILALAAGACSSTPAGTAVPPSPSPAPDCASPLSPSDLAGGFLSGEAAAPTSGTIIEAVLAAGEDGPLMTGRRILFDGAFNGPPPVMAKGGAMIALEAATPRVDAATCAGSVHIAASADLLGGNSKGEAFAEAELGGITVGGGSPFCTALSAGPGTFAVECPSIGIRIGSQASVGTLWLRFRSAGEPSTAATMPSWFEGLTGPVPPIGTAVPSPPPVGTVRVDDKPFELQSFGDLDGVVIEPQADGTKVGYRAMFTFTEGDLGSELTVGIPDYAGPGVHTTGAFVGYTRTVPLDGGLTRTAAFNGRTCRVEISDDELQGSASCTLTAEAPDKGTVDVKAEWIVASVRRSVGAAVRVHWTLGGAYVSEGQATVLASVNTPLDPSILRVAEVLVGHPGTSDLLRIDIRGFTGDGTYTGESVDPSIQNVFSDSPNLRINVATPSGPTKGPDEREMWSPALGTCTATVRDGGASGEIRCPGYPIEDSPTGGSVMLFATWEPA